MDKLIKAQAMREVIANLGANATNQAIREKLKVKYGLELTEPNFYTLKGRAIKKLKLRRKKSAHRLKKAAKSS